MLVAPLAADAREQHACNPSSERNRQALAPGIALGDFPLAEHPVVDGDTLRLDGVCRPVRLVFLDTEELFHREEDRQASASDFSAYLLAQRAAQGGDRPLKFGTPIGEAAADFARGFFDGVPAVRLERDRPREIADAFGRPLVHVFAGKAGQLLHYNLECVRAGFSPYFTKYGASRRFHSAFLAAQEEARRAKRGIWDPALAHYPDYPERLTWWDQRAAFVATFERDAHDRDGFVSLADADAIVRLTRLVGTPVVVLGIATRLEAGRPARVLLGKSGQQLPLVFFAPPVLAATGIARQMGEFVRVAGTVQRYRHKSGREELQIEIQRPEQVAGSRP